MAGRYRYFVFLIILLSLFSSCGGEKDKPNILLITIDTLRRDHVSCYGYPGETTPFIDGLAKEGSMFRHVITPQPQTSGSHASILTSLHPLTHGVTFNHLPLTDNVQTIAEVLKKNGYHTIGAIGVRLMSGARGFAQGFDSFSDRWERDPEYKDKGKYQRSARLVNKSLFGQIGEYLSLRQNKPLFMWVHYYDPHVPYVERNPITYKTRLPGAPGKHEKIKKYDREIRYTDDAVKELYGFLKEKGIAKRLVTCITADHGEQFGEHGLRDGHNDFYSETTRVPLIFHGFAIPANNVIHTYVSTMDIAVTLLGMINLSFDYPTEGIDLLDNPGSRKTNQKLLRGQDRKLLVIGTQRFARSLQLIGAPFAYILNLDHHSMFWYIPTRNSRGPIPISEKRFEIIHNSLITKEKNKTIIKLPHFTGTGLDYIVLRGDVHPGKKKNIHLSVRMEAFPKTFSLPVDVELQQQTQTIEVVYPVTIVDRLHVHMVFKGKEKNAASVNNLRYAFISAEEFPGNREKILNRIWGILLTRRKDKNIDELFDLSGDIEMQKNLLESGPFKPTVLQYKKQTYSAYKYYSEKKNKILKGRNRKESLTAEEKKMLKSLGYF